MQYAYMAACAKAMERGAEVPFSFHHDYRLTAQADARFSEAAEVQKLVCRAKTIR